MKRLFTLVALMACFLGAKAEWVVDYKIDYSTYSGFPFFVMGYVPEWIDGVMTDFGANYRYETQENLDGEGDSKWKEGESSAGTSTTDGGTEYQKVTGAGPYWHQYFIADNIPTEIDGSYTVKALVKASEAVTINVNMGWGWGQGQQMGGSVSIPQSDEFVEVEWEYNGVAGTSCNLVAQPGTSTATIEWKSLTVSHNAKETRPTTWQQWLTNDGNPIIPEVATESIYMGDAEFGAWPAWALEKTDGINANWRTDRAGEICAWSLTMGDNFDDQCADFGQTADRSRPYPSDIEAEAGNESNHVFAVHVNQISCIDDCDGDAASTAWSNQFWIQSPKTWKSGTSVRIKFRYKAAHACSVGTQIHTQYPSVYLHYEAVGDVNFTEEWQEFDKTLTFNDAQGGGASLAFNLCSDATNGRTPNVFYFDDLSWETMVLDEGYFVAGCNTTTGLEYDFDNAIPFEGEGELVATIGEKGKPDTYVDQIMISTIRGNDASFKSNTLKPNGTVTNNPDNWLDYEPASIAKVNLPGSGVWKITIDTYYKAMAFEMLEGEVIEIEEIKPNETEVIVKGQERDDLSDTFNNGERTGREEEGGTGEAWDNQLFIVANRELSTGEVTVISFKYKSTVPAKTSTQLHGNPGAYMHWGAIGDVNFTEEWQEFEYTLTIPSEANGMKSIAFNMAEIKAACDYHVKDVIWKTSDDRESLIDQTGAKNFYVKEGAGTDPYEFGTDPAGISTVVNDNKASNVIYNIAGQRVSKDYKGIVVKKGNKYVVK